MPLVLLVDAYLVELYDRLGSVETTVQLPSGVACKFAAYLDDEVLIERECLEPAPCPLNGAVQSIPISEENGRVDRSNFLYIRFRCTAYCLLIHLLSAFLQ